MGPFFFRECLFRCKKNPKDKIEKETYLIADSE